MPHSADRTLAATFEQAQRDLLDAFRRAGMAEVATGVLHVVQNALSAIVQSAGIIEGRLQASPIENIGLLSDRLAIDAGAPERLSVLATQLEAERSAVLAEVEVLQQHIDRIKQTVSRQQAFARVPRPESNAAGLDDPSAGPQPAKAALEKTRLTLAEASRRAGRAEVATGVLHNVGNVLNSLNVSASLIAATLRQSKTVSLLRVAELVREQPGPLAEFLLRDTKGRLVPNFLVSLGRQLGEERKLLLSELRSLRSNLDHIQELVVGQQQQSASGETSALHAAKVLLDDALRMTAAALTRDSVVVVRHYELASPVWAQRGKVLQILINLIRNAHEAVNESGHRQKLITLAIEASEPDQVRLTVSDNGIGIAAENLARLFGHGFTTRTDGHGFGLHTSAQAARELGGSLTAASAGAGQGASFTLILPAPRTPPDPPYPMPAAESPPLG